MWTGLTDTTCGGTTVNNIDTIDVDAGIGVNNLTIDLSGGQLAPGLSTETPGVPEIEMNVNLSLGIDKVTVQGGTSDDLLDATSSGIKVTGDDDVDIVNTFVNVIEVRGSDGNDTLSPGGGTSNDALDGGAGRDTVDYERSPFSGTTTGVTVNLGTVGDGAVGGAGDQNTVAAGSDDLVGIESILGSFYDDTLTGDGSNNFIFGWGGNDVINGFAGNDGLSGGDGNDSLSGGDGNDQFYGGIGTDTCDGGIDVDDFANDDGTCETELNAP